MKALLLSISLLSSLSVSALEAKDVESVVKKYAEAVACGSEYGDFGFKAVKVAGEANSTNPYEDYYAVVWQGDLGCQGGSGAGGTQISVVAVMAGSTPVVLPASSIQVPARILENAAGGKGLLVVEGVTYKKGDPNCCPSGSESFVYRFDPKSESMVPAK